MKTMRVRLTFIDSVLGTASGDPEVHSTYIAGKVLDNKIATGAGTKEEREQKFREEVEAIGEEGVEEKQMTVFPRNKDGEPIFWDYQIRGFFKSACSALGKIPGTKSSKLKAYKKQIDLRIFVFPDAKKRAGREIVIHTDKPIGSLQRPLRAQTMQGERVALANSEEIEAGAWCEFDILMLNDDDADMIREWLDYGSLNGLGAWRNSAHGAFSWDEIGKDGKIIGGNGDDYRETEKESA